MNSVQHPPLVGRQSELGTLVDLITQTGTGNPAVVAVVGEGGVGKSRLAWEAVQNARLMGCVTLLGRADDFDCGVPFAVFRDMLGRVDLRSLDVDALDAVLALDQALALDTAVAGSGEPGDHVSIVFGLLRALLNILGRRHTSVVLTLEDLQLADAESIHLLSLLCRHTVGLPLLVIVTSRSLAGKSNVPLSKLLDHLQAEGRAEIIQLDRLDRLHVRALMSSSLGRSPEDDFVDVVFERSRGNPFFAHEVLGHAQRFGLIADGEPARLLGLLPSVAGDEIALRRYFDTSGPEADVARVMSTFGRFSLRHLPLLERLTEGTSAVVAQSFDRLVESGVVVRTAQGSYEFSQPLLRDSVYSSIGPAERRRMHGVIADALVEERRAGLAISPLELATHVAESAVPGDLCAVEVLVEAARVSGRTAPLVSAGWYGIAADLLPPGDARDEALTMQTRQLLIGGRAGQAVAIGQRALAMGGEGANRRRVASMVVNAMYICGRGDEAVALIDEELAAGAAAVPLLAQRTHLLAQGCRGAEAEAQLDAALHALDTPGASSASEVVALTHLLHYTRLSPRPDLREQILTRMAVFDDTISLQSRTTLLDGCALECSTGAFPDFLLDADRHLAAARALRTNTSETSYAGQVEAAMVHTMFYRGLWDEALELARRASFDLVQREATICVGVLRSYDALICAARGDIDRVRSLQTDLHTPSRAIQGVVTLAFAAGLRALGDVSAAKRSISTFLGSAGPQPPVEAALLLEELADLALDDGEDDVACQLVDRIVPGDAYSLTWVIALRAHAVAHRDPDAARQAVDGCRAIGMPFELARAQVALAALGVDAHDNLIAAHAVFSALGALGWRKRAARAMRTAGITAPRTRATHDGDVLSGVDSELARLLGHGLTNAQIASALHYSRKTVEVYLSRIYRRTGCRSRLDLVRAIDRGTIALVD